MEKEHLLFQLNMDVAPDTIVHVPSIDADYLPEGTLFADRCALDELGAQTHWWWTNEEFNRDNEKNFQVVQMTYREFLRGPLWKALSNPANAGGLGAMQIFPDLVKYYAKWNLQPDVFNVGSV